MDLQEALNEIRGSYKSLYEEQKRLREEAEEEKKEAEKECEECKKELEECRYALAEYQQIGEAADILQTLQEYAELGFSSPTEAQFILSQLQEEAEESVDKEEIEDIKKDIEEAAEKLAAYEALGTVSELRAIKEKAEELVDELDKKEDDEVTERLARKFGIPESIARKFVEAAEDEEEAEKELEESLEGMADVDIDDEKSGTDIDDFEDDHNLPDSVNDNDVEAVPDVVEESLRKIVGSNRAPKNTMLEGYTAGSIVNSMFD